MPPAPFDRLDTAAYALPPGVLDRRYSPSLVVFEAVVRANVARVLAVCGGDADRRRPHVKTTKSPELWRLLLARSVHEVGPRTPRFGSCRCFSGAGPGGGLSEGAEDAGVREVSAGAERAAGPPGRGVRCAAS